MSKRDYSKSYEYAKIINDKFCIESNCYQNGKVIEAKYLVCIDDDITSAFMAAKLARKMVEEGQTPPVILCVGGKGPMSFFTHWTSEANNLGKVVKKVLPRKYYSNIVLLAKGTNTGDNILGIKNYLITNVERQENVIFCLTKRLSLRLMLTKGNQASCINAYYNISDDSFEETPKLYNYKALCKLEPLFHELAAILDRCVAYAGIYQDPIPEGMVTDEIKEAASYLEEHYRYKLPSSFFYKLRKGLKFVSALLIYMIPIFFAKRRKVKEIRLLLHS